MELLINCYKFKPLKKTNKRSSSNTIKRISKLVNGLVFVENGIYKIRVFDDNNITSSGDKILDFTDRSYNLKGKEIIFDKVFNDTDKRTRYIRSKIHAITFPGNSEVYVPFAPNWIADGYIVEINDKQYFDFNSLVTINGHDIVI